MAYFLSKNHLQELELSGLNSENILDSKIFTVEDKTESKKLTGYALKGMIIPYFDPTGKAYTTSSGAAFYRNKPDWSEFDNPDEKPKYLTPQGEGNRPYFAPTYKKWDKALRCHSIPIHITEGEKKALLLGAKGFAAIGLTGVHGWMDKNVRDEEVEDIPAQMIEDLEDRDEILNKLEESRPLPELEFIGNGDIWKGRKVFITFDSDIVQKWQVKNALKSLADWLASKGAEVYVVLLPNEINGDKNGVDDFVVRHGIAAYEELVKVSEPAFTYSKRGRKFNFPTEPDLPQKSAMLKSVLKDSWRYRPGIGWHNWKGTHWQLTDDGVGSYIDSDIYDFMTANKWKSQGNGGLSTLVRHMKAKLLVEHWNPPHKIAFQNGILDLKSGNWDSAMKPDLFITVVLPYYFDPTAQSPNWVSFLKTALKGDTKAIELIRAFFKYALLPKFEGNSLQVCLDLYGVEGTGKGTVMETLRQLVGTHNCGHFSTRTIGNPNAHAEMLDKRVSTCPDDSGHLEDVGTFNRIVSNEPVSIKHLYKNSFSAPLNTFLVRAYNSHITTPANSHGLNRRVIAMTFNQQPKQPDCELGNKLKAELPGIFNWAWQMSIEDMKKTIATAGEIECVVEASTERFFANNPVFVFLREEYPNGGEVKIRELHKHYQEWCKDTGRMYSNQRVFADSLLRFGCQKKSKSDGQTPYILPKMGDDKVLQILGIGRGIKSVDSHDGLEIPSNSGEKVESRENQVTSVPSNSLNQNPDSEKVIGNTDALREIRDGFSETIFIKESDGGDDSTLSDVSTDSSTKTEPPAKPIAGSTTAIETKSTRGYGVNFPVKTLANEWKSFIALKFGCYGEVMKAATKPQSGKGKDRDSWYLSINKATAELIAFLESADLTTAPPVGA
jgi:P4 family phage/plasmid primase-like protien